jgi:hypothetical protein
MSYRYTLEKYKGSKTKYNCEHCNGKKTFTRYIDTQTGAHLPEKYGRCNSENSCGYHLNPYRDGYSKETYKEDKERMKPIVKPKPVKNVEIPLEIFNASINPKFYQDNQFMKNIIVQLGESLALEKAKEYYVGTSKHWQGATVFWFIGSDNKPKAGQIKLFDESNHTVKYVDGEGVKKSKTTFIHAVIYKNLKEEKKPIPQWLNDYYQVETKVSCLFGEHLLEKYPNKTIALVEAPKTAIIASAYYSKYVWLATGSLSYLTEDRCKALQGRKVVLFPDLNALSKWEEKALKSLSKCCKYSVNDFLEKNAPKQDIEAGYDLADYLANLNMKPKAYQTPFIQDNDYLNSLFFDENGTLCTGTHREHYPANWDLSAPYISQKAKDFVKMTEQANNTLKKLSEKLKLC